MAESPPVAEKTAPEHFMLDPEIGFTLAPEFVAEIILAIDREDVNLARDLITPLLAQDQAELFEQLMVKWFQPISRRLQHTAAPFAHSN